MLDLESVFKIHISQYFRIYKTGFWSHHHQFVYPFSQNLHERIPYECNVFVKRCHLKKAVFSPNHSVASDPSIINNLYTNAIPYGL